jgi:hypothetical protein
MAGEELGSGGLPLWMTQPSKPTYGLLDSDDDGKEEEAEDGAAVPPSSYAGGSLGC